MRKDFALFQTPLDLAHDYWRSLLQPGDWAIDATCGNGKDTLFLAELLLSEADSSSGIIALDIQSQAIQKSKFLFESHGNREKVHFFCTSHEEFPGLAYENPIKLVVYNLGYLPGSDKQVKTESSSTLESIKKSLSLLQKGGAISIACYPGHPEGAEEEKNLLHFFTILSPQEWSVCLHRFINRNASPSLIIIQKKLF